ncbi:MAG: hypothetical protein A4S09_06460 [Proteobacteria bacterium SG_bin7]|nr:MAG: hypothetical protein A4S09_06460 [Proteobacteria bacterium SG_bin7]
MRDFTIGKLAKESGVGVETVRFYERQGLVKKPTTKFGYRKYVREDAKRIRFIKRAQALGFALREVKDFLNLNTNPRSKCEDIRNRANEKIKEIKIKISDLEKMKESLEVLSQACGDGKKPLAQCEVLDCFEVGFRC